MLRPLLLALAGTLVGAVVATGALLVAGDAGMAVVWALAALAAAALVAGELAYRWRRLRARGDAATRAMWRS